MPVYPNIIGTRHHHQEFAADEGPEVEDKDYAHPPPDLSPRNEPMSETGEEHKKPQRFELFQPRWGREPKETIPMPREKE